MLSNFEELVDKEVELARLTALLEDREGLSQIVLQAHKHNEHYLSSDPLAYSLFVADRIRAYLTEQK